MKNIRPVKITKIKEDSVSVTEDEVILDTFLTVSLNGKRVASFICLPGSEEEASIGYLFSTGILRSIDKVGRIKREGYNVDIQTSESVTTKKMSEELVSTACGTPEEWLKLRKGYKLPTVESSLRVRSNAITLAMERLNEISETFKRTGGTHAAALFKPDGDAILSAEDVSRHMAVDKVIGKALLNKVNLEELFLATTGRLAGDMVIKAVYVGIPIVASIAAPLNSGIQLAEATNLTLVGFVRGKRMNIYAHPERIETGK